MNRLFIKIAIGIFVALVASVVLAVQATRWAGFDETIEKTMQKHAEEIAHAKEALDRVQPSEYEATLQSLEPTLDHLRGRLHIVRLDGPGIPPHVRERLAVTPTVFDFGREAPIGGSPLGRGPLGRGPLGRGPLGDGPPAGPSSYHVLSNPNYVLAAGPLPPPLPAPAIHLLIVLAIILPVVITTAYLLTKPVVKRLTALEQVTTTFGHGDLTARSADTSMDPIGRFAQGFNLMADRIQRLVDDQRYLLQAVSHELRQPLSRIRFNLELLQENDDPDARARRIEKTESDIEELGDLIKELTLYVRMETEFGAPRRKPLVVRDALVGLVDKHRMTRPEIALEIAEPLPREIVVIAHETHFTRALGNLISNAVRAANSRVVLSASTVNSELEITVSDDGPGVSPEDRARIFQPFVRLDGSRSRDLGGVGLGLAIVDRIVKAHGGTVAVDRADGGGARFATRWPIPTDLSG